MKTIFEGGKEWQAMVGAIARFRQEQATGKAKQKADPKKKDPGAHQQALDKLRGILRKR